MTKYVGVGDNRAAAKARAARHAQRNPLPPRGSKPLGNPSVEAMLEELAEMRARRDGERGVRCSRPQGPPTEEQT